MKEKNLEEKSLTVFTKELPQFLSHLSPLHNFIVCLLLLPPHQFDSPQQIFFIVHIITEESEKNESTAQ